jgi:hypothetical protein
VFVLLCYERLFCMFVCKAFVTLLPFLVTMEKMVAHSSLPFFFFLLKVTSVVDILWGQLCAGNKYDKTVS